MSDADDRRVPRQAAEQPVEHLLSGFVERAKELAAKYGHRFEPPASLIEKAEKGEVYSDEEAAVAAA